MFAGPPSYFASNAESTPDTSMQFGKLGIFMNGSYSTGNRDQTGREPGFDVDVVGVTGGVDYRFTDNFVLGVAFGYSRTDANMESSAGDVDVNGYAVSLYGSYSLDKFYIDGFGTYGQRDYEITRNVQYSVENSAGTGLTNVNQSFSGDTNANEYSFGLGAGYDFSKGGLHSDHF